MEHTNDICYKLDIENRLKWYIKNSTIDQNTTLADAKAKLVSIFLQLLDVDVLEKAINPVFINTTIDELYEKIMTYICLIFKYDQQKFYHVYEILKKMLPNSPCPPFTHQKKENKLNTVHDDTLNIYTK